MRAEDVTDTLPLALHFVTRKIPDHYFLLRFPLRFRPFPTGFVQ